MIILKMSGIELNDDFLCDDCPLLQWEEDCGFCSGFNEDGAYGRYLPEHYGEKDIYQRPDWCPLRELPDKQETLDDIDYDAGFIDGWNTCIDKISGKDVQE